jgi:hypothetical protein
MTAAQLAPPRINEIAVRITGCGPRDVILERFSATAGTLTVVKGARTLTLGAPKGLLLVLKRADAGAWSEGTQARLAWALTPRASSLSPSASRPAPRARSASAATPSCLFAWTRRASPAAPSTPCAPRHGCPARSTRPAAGSPRAPRLCWRPCATLRRRRPASGRRGREARGHGRRLNPQQQETPCICVLTTCPHPNPAGRLQCQPAIAGKGHAQTTRLQQEHLEQRPSRALPALNPVAVLARPLCAATLRPHLTQRLISSVSVAPRPLGITPTLLSPLPA